MVTSFYFNITKKELSLTKRSVIFLNIWYLLIDHMINYTNILNGSHSILDHRKKLSDIFDTTLLTITFLIIQLELVTIMKFVEFEVQSLHYVSGREIAKAWGG